MVAELHQPGGYSPAPPQDMWAFAILLLRTVGGRRSQAHLDAIHAARMEQSDDKALAFALSLLDPGNPEYHEQVNLHIKCAFSMYKVSCLTLLWIICMCMQSLLH